MTDQYTLETTWSTRLTDNIIIEAIQDEIPQEMESNVLGAISSIGTSKTTDDKEIFVKLFSLVLKDRVARPIQALAIQLGFSNDIKSPPHAFDWGWLLLKECVDSGLYTLRRINNEWYVFPLFTLNEDIQHKLDKLQFLPPMKKRPNDWENNHNGGWVWEHKHLILGSRLNRHDKPLAYDVINKLQSIPWEIDPSTYLFEKETNHSINKAQFLKVIDEYIGKHFYFVWRYDSRGRSYSSGYHLNLQTNEYGKALLSMHKKEVITELPNLYIAIANHAGKDTLTWKDRVDWVAKQDIENIKWKEPILGRKALRALNDTVAGKPTGYVMSLDATSSGIQIMAVISGCRETAKFVNCINPNKRYDLYNEVTKMMNKELSERVNRKTVKYATMTYFYNSEATPKRLFSTRQLQVFYEVLKGLLPGAEHVMKAINQCWNYNKDYHSWIMPDGHTVYVPVVDSITATYRDSEYGAIPLRWDQQIKSNDFRSLCPNVIHSIDGYVAREMIRRCKFQLSHVHDCFVFNPNHLQDVATTYKTIMAEIAKSDLFGNILRQLTGKGGLKVHKNNNSLDVDILKSEYMLS